MADWLDVSSTAPRIAYTATASQTVFTVPFVFFEEADLKVYKNGTLLTLATHYTTAGAESESGGTITLLTGATAGDVIMIVRDLAIVQTTHIPPSGPLDIPALNIQFSKLIAIDQQLDNALDRSIHFPDSDSTTSAELAAAATRAGKLLGFGTSGELIYPLGPSFVSDTATGVALVDSRATAEVTTFAVSVNVVRTAGLVTPGDGGGTDYVRGLVGDPGAFQDGGSVYWKTATLGVADVESRATAALKYFPSTISIIATRGLTTPGDGGGRTYKRGISTDAGAFQDAGGNYWAYDTSGTVTVLGNILYADDYGVAADYQTVTGNTSIASGTKNLTVAGASFVAADVGKMIQVPGAGAAGATLSTTISAYVGPTQLTLTANAGTTLSAVSKTVTYATNDYTNFQAFLTALCARGGMGVTKPGTSFISGNNLSFAQASGVQKVELCGYGTVITTDPLQNRIGLAIQNVAAVTRSDDSRNTLIAGLSFNQIEDVNAVGAISITQSPHVTLRDITIQAGGDTNTPTSYYGIGFFQGDIADPNTGSFWCVIDGCNIHGGTHRMQFGIWVRGSAGNALVVTNTELSLATYGIYITNSGGGVGTNAAYVSNGVRITNNSFEGVDYGVYVDGTLGTSRIVGLEISYNRIESIAQAFYVNGLTAAGGTENDWPTVLGPNYVSSESIAANYVYNPNLMPINSHDDFIGTASYSPAGLAAGATITLATIPVTNALTLDFVEMSADKDLLGLVLTGTAGTNVVTPRLTNPTTALITAPSGVKFKARVRKNY